MLQEGYRRFIFQLQLVRVVVQLRVQLREFYGSATAYDDLPDQAAIHGRTVGHRRPVGRVILRPQASPRTLCFASQVAALQSPTIIAC